VDGILRAAKDFFNAVLIDLNRKELTRAEGMEVDMEGKQSKKGDGDKGSSTVKKLSLIKNSGKPVD
jgi:hypothetical protein